MNRLTRSALALPLLALAAVLAFVSPARAARVVPHKEKCAGTLTAVLPPSATLPLPSLQFAGVGMATHLGRYRITGSNQFNPQTGEVLNGQFTSVAADGSTISGTYAGTFREIAPNVVQFNVRVLYLRGTRRLAGVTGVADTVAVLNGVSTGSTFTYTTNGFFRMP